MAFRQAHYDEPLIFERDGGRHGTGDASCLAAASSHIPEGMLRRNLELPDLTEPEVVRHFTRLSQMNFGVDSGFYPLGSCTMKYNPKINEEISGMPEFTETHPLQNESTVQGNLMIMYELQEMLATIAGMDAVTLQPVAGAHGEFTGLLLIRAYHEARGDTGRTEVIVPDTAHGTNPASAVMAGYRIVEIRSGDDGCVDMEALGAALSERTAGMMITNPNTVGIFEDPHFADLVHEAGALLYYDGANLNAIMGRTTPGLMGFDVVHFNLHKTFSTPHGGGGPGSGAVGVKKHLTPFLPRPVVARRCIGPDGVENDRCRSRECDNHHEYHLDCDRPQSIGKIAHFYGNFGVMLKAYAYIRRMGGDGLRKASGIAVLNSNYICRKLSGHYPIPYKELKKHEFVASAAKLKEERGMSAKDVAKRLLDYGYHAPTTYFPLIVEDALMIEPTESEPLYEIDGFIDAMKTIATEDKENVCGAPCCTGRCRIDEVKAAKDMKLTWKMTKE